MVCVLQIQQSLMRLVIKLVQKTALTALKVTFQSLEFYGPSEKSNQGSG